MSNLGSLFYVVSYVGTIMSKLHKLARRFIKEPIFVMAAFHREITVSIHSFKVCFGD